MTSNTAPKQGESRSMSFGTDSYHYVVTPDGEMIKNEDAFKPRISNAEAGRMADLQNAWSRAMWQKHEEARGVN